MRSLVVYAASGCNLRCKHCAVGSDQLRPRESLTADDLCKILDSAADSGVSFITLIGGEVFFVHDDLSRVFELASERGIGISLNTNLYYPQKIIELQEHSSLKNVSFSLDGASAETHDKIRGRGSFGIVRKNYDLLRRETRHRTDISFDLNFTLNALNAEDAFELVALAGELKVRKINFAITEPKDFAARNSPILSLSGDNLLHAMNSFLFTWLAEGECELDINIPPLYARYVSKLFGYNNLPINYAACGGTSVYGYVDNAGNHLPCPSMSFEHSRSTLRDKSFSYLDARKTRLLDIWGRSTFRGFEKARSSGSLMREMFPCNFCKFNSICRPCTHMIISGEGAAEQQLCAAIARSNDPAVSELKEELLPTLRA